MLKILLFTSMAVTAIVMSMPQARASTLIGSQVTATVDYPTFGNAASYPDTQTVTGGVEFPSGSLQLLPAYGGIRLIGVNIAVGASSIDFDYTQADTALAAAFNGYVLDFGGAPTITGVSLDPASSFTPSQVGLSFTGDQIAYNGQGLTFNDGSQVIVDVSFAPVGTPEPQSGTLFLGGVGLLITGALLRRKETACAR